MTEKEANVFGKVANGVDNFFEGHFYRIGLFVGTRPCTSIGVSILFCLTCMSGFSQLNAESRSDKLWIPQDTQAQQDQVIYNQYFPPKTRMQMILMEAKSGSALDKKALTGAMALHKVIEDVKVPSSKGGDDTLRTLCISKPDDGHPCFINSILMLWNFDEATLAADNNPLATINAAGKTKDDLNRMVGDAVWDSNGKLVSAKAIQSTYFNQNNRERQGGGYEDKRGDDWEEKLLEALKCDTPKCTDGDCICDYASDDFTIYVLAARSWRDVFGNVIRGDVGLINMAFFIMAIYLTLNLGGLCHKIKMRSLLALGCLGSIVLAGAAGYGLAMWFQFDYTPVMSVLPFVMLGIGVDDSFVIMNALDGVSPSLPVPERIATTLSHAGVSIFVTSVTDFVAFAISVTSALPALSAFCMYAALSIIMLFILQVTLFSALATYDSYRVDAGKIDCCPCCCTRGCPCCPTVPPADALNANGSDANQMCCAQSTHKGGRIGRFLEKTYAPALVKTPVAIVITLIAFLFCGLCVWQVSELNVEEATPKFVPDDSYVRVTVQKQDRYFGLLGQSFSIVTEGGDYFATQAGLTSIGARLDQLSGFVKPPSTMPGSFESWAESFQAYLKTPASAGGPGLLVSADANGHATVKSQYYSGLNTWLQAQGRPFAKDVIWVDGNDPQKGIRASRIHGELKPFNVLKDEKIMVDSDRSVEVMDDLRDAVATWTDLPGGKAFSYSFKFLEWEVFRIIKKEMFLSVGLCLLAVLIVCMVIIAHPVTAGLVFLCVVITILDILGCMNMWGLAIDNVTVIQLVIAVGLSVDYAAHIGHNFMTKGGTRGERVTATLGDVGSAVLNGGVSTFLAVMLLALSKSYVFRVLFQTFFLTVVLGLFHGMVVLPAMLSLIGPAGYGGRVDKSASSGAETVGKAAEDN